MAVPTDIYSLHEITAAGDSSTWLLLTRVSRRGFANWNQVDEDDANKAATNHEELLVKRFLSENCESEGAYESRKVGELQHTPVGDILADPKYQGDVDLWIAATSYGPPWIVLGTAASEEAFWAEVRADEDLVSLNPQRPARRVQAQYRQSSTYTGDSNLNSR